MANVIGDFHYNRRLYEVTIREVNKVQIHSFIFQRQVAILEKTAGFKGLSRDYLTRRAVIELEEK